MHTIDEAKAWVAERKPELIASLRAYPDVPEFMKKPGSHFEDVWCSGCWMNDQLRAAGASEEEIHNIGFCHGQRSAFGDTWKWAVAYLNEFEQGRGIQDKPGNELADKINDVHLQVVGPGCVAIAVERE